MMIVSIASLFAFETPEMSQVMVCQVSAATMFGVVSVVVPPLSWIPTLIFEPVREARISNLMVLMSVRLMGVEIVRIRVLFRLVAMSATPFKE